MKYILKPGSVWIAFFLLIPLLVLPAGCFAVRVKENVGEPERYFENVYERIERIHRNDPHRRGKAGEVRLLIYDFNDRDLIRIKAPFWLMNMCVDIERKAENPDDFDFEENYQFEWRELKDLKDVGPGLLVEVEDEGTRLLVWIE